MADMDSTSPPHTFLPMIGLLLVSGYGMYHCYHIITRFRQYEEQTDKVAEYFDTVAQRLYRTRTTQMGATIAVLISFVTAELLVCIHNQKHLVAAALFNTAILFFSRTQMANFWNDRNQLRVPFIEKFNEAIEGSEIVVKVLGWLCGAWFVAGFLWLCGM